MQKLDVEKTLTILEIIECLAERVKNSNSSNDAMKNSQAALNFANALATLAQSQRDERRHH